MGGVLMLTKRALISTLLLTPTAALAGPLRNPDRVDHFNLTKEDVRTLVWYANNVGLRFDELGLTAEDVFESTDVLKGGLFLHDDVPGLTRKGWMFLAGFDVNPE